MKKILVSLMGILILLGFAGDVSMDQQSEVHAQSQKTKCLFTADEIFHCEGNPGYEQALIEFEANK